jgi:amino acid transporter
MSQTVEKQPELKRVMGPGLLLLFVVGDILGTGVYALTGDVAAEVGGAAWVPFLVAFLIATVTALSYLELVTKYPQAAGAAPLRTQSLRHPVRDVPDRLRGDVLGDHVGVDGVSLLCGELLPGV